MSLEISRRSIIKAGGVLDIAAARGLFPSIPERDVSEVSDPTTPQYLEDIFSLSPEYINHNPQSIQQVDTVENEAGIAISTYILPFSEGTLQKITFDQPEGKYVYAGAKHLPSMSAVYHFAAFSSGKEDIVVVGGSNELDFTNPAMEISKDGGESFEPITGVSERNGEYEIGLIRYLKEIPGIPGVLVQQEHWASARTTFGICDANGAYSLVEGEYKNVPTFDDLAVDSTNKLLFGSGIVFGEPTEPGEPNYLGINDYSIDLSANKVTNSVTHHKDLPSISDLAVLRDRNGSSEIEFGISVLRDGKADIRSVIKPAEGKSLERKLFEIDVATGKVAAYDYGRFFDERLSDEFGFATRSVLLGINVTEGGLWVNGLHQAVDTKERYSFAAHVPHGSTFEKKDASVIYAFPEVTESYAIHDKLLPVRFANKSENQVTHGLLTVLSYKGGVALLETNADYSPMQEKRIFYYHPKQ